MRFRTIILTIILALAIPAAAAAAPLLSFRAAKHVFRQEAYRITLRLHADRFTVNGCFRINTAHVVCHLTFYRIPSPLMDCSNYAHAIRTGASIDTWGTKATCWNVDH